MIPSNPGFCDFCVEANDADPQILRRILLRLHKLGYETVAINQTVDEAIFDTEKKKKKKPAAASSNEITKSQIPLPLDVEDLKKEFANKLTILSRLTFLFSDTSKVYTLGQSPNLKKYDLYGIIPKNQIAFQFACAQLNTDLITIKSSCSGLKFSRKLYLQAVERGVHFEIQYADVVKPETRKHAIHYSHQFHIFGKSKNIIISSGATDEALIRNPYDVINLASLFGLSEVKSKASILSQCRQLLLKAESRRYGKAVFTIESHSKNVTEESNDSENTDSKRIKL